LGDDRIISSPGITVRDLGTGKSIEPVVVANQPSTGSDVKATPIIISPPPSRAKPEITEIRGTTKVVTTP
jgi:hypothetical protein